MHRAIQGRRTDYIGVGQFAKHLQKEGKTAAGRLCPLRRPAFSPYPWFAIGNWCEPRGDISWGRRVAVSAHANRATSVTQYFLFPAYSHSGHGIKHHVNQITLQVNKVNPVPAPDGSGLPITAGTARFNPRLSGGKSITAKFASGLVRDAGAGGSDRLGSSYDCRGQLTYHL